MPRTSPVTFRAGIAYVESSGDGLLSLIVISAGPGAPFFEPLRFVRDQVPVTSGGETYDPLWFAIQEPEMRSDGSYAQSHLKIDAVDQSMVRALRETTRPMALLHKYVRMGDPDEVTHGPWNYQIRGGQPWDQYVLELELTFEPTLLEQAPWKKLSPSRAPGLY